MKKITLLVPTHCIKTERNGLYKGVANIVPSAPSTKMIEHILNDFFTKTNLKEEEVDIHIGLDKRKNRQIDENYHENLKLLSNRYKNLKVIANESEIDDPIVTAPQNFLQLIDSVETEIYVFWEHDWVLNTHIELRTLIDEVYENRNVNYIRLNQFDNNNLRYNNLIENSRNPSDKVPLIQTFRWSNNPYICKTEVFQKWWKTFVYPTSNEGGFVEGPLNELFAFYIDKMGIEKGLDVFGCFVYGGWNDRAIVSHLNGNSWY